MLFNSLSGDILRFDMHIHTVYSKHWFFGIDGLDYPKDMIRAAIKKGLNGMAITDHNNIKGALIAIKEARDIDKDFKIIPGVEVRSIKGDILALGIKEDVKPLMTVEETVEKIHELGGIAIAAHPFSAFVFRNVLQNEAMKTDGIEILNACNSRFYQDYRSMRLARKYSMPVSAGSDSHSVISVGNAGIICEGDPLEAIMNKKVKIFGDYTPYRHMTFQILEKLGRSAKWLLFKKEKRNIIIELNQYILLTSI